MTRETIYRFIAAEKTTYPVRLLCRVLQVSTSAFYDWIHRDRPAVADTDLDDAHAANELHNAWVEHRRTYGARRLTAEIHARGQDWNRKKVARLMTVAGIEGIHRRRHGKKRTRIGAGSVAPDLVKRPDQLWVADISYLRTWRASSIWPWSSTPAPAASSGGRWPITYAANWSSTPWAWPCTSANRPPG
jgi:putative transposase